jgi:hypothetical protein
MDINRLKKFDATSWDMEELVGVATDLNALSSMYSSLQIEPPEWIGDKISEVKIAVNALARAERQNKRKKLVLEKARLMTPDEKRKKIEEEIAALDALEN